MPVTGSTKQRCRGIDWQKEYYETSKDRNSPSPIGYCFRGSELWQLADGARVGGFHCAFLTQKERDIESGLDYFLARYYSSAQGRFTSSDPLLSSATVYDPQTWNRYSYTLNNPLKYIDPFGLYVWDASLGGSATDEELK